MIRTFPVIVALLAAFGAVSTISGCSKSGPETSHEGHDHENDDHDHSEDDHDHDH